MPPTLDLERLYDDHAQALFSFLLNLTRDEGSTRDLLQETYLKLALRPQLLRGARDERAFLIRLAHNLAIDLMRRRAVRQKYTEQSAGETTVVFAPTSDPDTASLRQELAAALG